MKILLAGNLSMARKWNPTQTGLNKQQKLLVRITSKSRMAWATSTDMESLRPSLYSAFFSMGCNFRNVLPCKATSRPVAPDNQVHHLSCTWLSLSDSNRTAAEAEQQGELWQTCIHVWLSTRVRLMELKQDDTVEKSSIITTAFSHTLPRVSSTTNNLAWSQKPRHCQPQQTLTHSAILIWKQM